MSLADPHWTQLLDREPDLDDPASHPGGTWCGFPYDDVPAGKRRPRWGVGEDYQIALREQEAA